MKHRLEFEKLINYDAGIDGISLNVELRLGDNSTNFVAKKLFENSKNVENPKPIIKYQISIINYIERLFSFMTDKIFDI